MGLGSWLKKKQKAYEKNTNRFLKKMGASNVSSQFNFKKLVTDPKQYFKNNYDNFKDDAVHAVGVYKMWVTGDWSTLGKKGTADTRAAFGLKKDKKQEKQAEAIGQTYEDVEKGDYEKAAKSLEKADLGLVSEAAGKVAPVAGYAGTAVKAYGAYEKGDYDKAVGEIEKADIKYVSEVAGAVKPLAAQYEAHEKAEKKKAGTGGDVKLLSEKTVTPEVKLEAERTDIKMPSDDTTSRTPARRRDLIDDLFSIFGG